MMTIIPANTKIDFMGKLRYAIVLSTIGTALGLLLNIYPGLHFGIDFRGGTEIQLKFNETTDPGIIRDALAELGLPNDSVQRYGAEADNEFIIRMDSATFQGEGELAKIQTILTEKFGAKVSNFRPNEEGTRLSFKREVDVTADQAQTALNSLGTVQVVQDPVDEQILNVGFGDPSERLSKTLSAALPAGSFQVVRIDTVGPRVGQELKTQAGLAVIFSGILVLLYVALRFETEFAPGAIICLIHDVSMTLLVLILTGSEFSLTTLAAIMTVVGYSLNDTIVVYDRIRENLRRHRTKDMYELINLSINETLSRTIITSGTTFLSVVALFVFGGPTIHDFALAMMVGIITGTYSSIYIAAPTIPFSRKILGITSDPSGGEEEPATT